jgi:glutathione S-transferase
MKRILYDLAAADEALRFSPYCWRIKLALAHKNLSYETVPWRFTEKDVIAFSGQGKVPVLVDGETTISGSQEVADYLERQYPNEASLFGEPPARALTMFIRAWTEDMLHPAIARIILPDIYAQLHPKDKAYFRASREKAWGMAIEDFHAGREGHVKALQAVLAPVRRTLAGQSFIAGDAPSYADHIVFGALQWGRLMSAAPLFAADDLLLAWMDAVLAVYGI